MTAERGAIADAVGELAGEASIGRQAAAGEQLDLSLPTRFAGPEAEAQREKARSGMIARGRPPGAQNRVTRDAKQLLLATGFVPLAWHARWGQHTPESLARELGCTIAEAWDRLERVHQVLNGFFVARPLPVDGAGNAVPFLQMVVGGLPTVAPGAAPMRKPWDYLDAEEMPENQAFTAPENGLSHVGKSHDEPSD